MAIKDWQSLSGIQFQLWVVEESDKIETLDHRQRSGPSHSGLENNVVIINIQMIINWMDLPNETLKFKVK